MEPRREHPPAPNKRRRENQQQRQQHDHEHGRHQQQQQHQPEQSQQQQQSHWQQHQPDQSQQQQSNDRFGDRHPSPDQQWNDALPSSFSMIEMDTLSSGTDSASDSHDELEGAWWAEADCSDAFRPGSPVGGGWPALSLPDVPAVHPASTAGVQLEGGRSGAPAAGSAAPYWSPLFDPGLGSRTYQKITPEHALHLLLRQSYNGGGARPDTMGSKASAAGMIYKEVVKKGNRRRKGSDIWHFKDTRTRNYNNFFPEGTGGNAATVGVSWCNGHVTLSEARTAAAGTGRSGTGSR
eukprot:SAG22_NODE_427_length_10603_cov_19.158225_1_plen_293_part_10